jgi:2-polyprenyl-3-methyl-5-hydroxy-6-metoxy-1,4-benzoquinol methylase
MIDIYLRHFNCPVCTGNVVVMFGVLHPTVIADVEALFSDGRTKLLVLIALTTGAAAANAVRLSSMFDLRSFSFSEDEFKCVDDDPYSLCITACHSYKLNRSSDSAMLAGIGFNHQPSVQSLSQFNFLWRGESSLECKERVLQRLADKEVKANILRPRKDNNNHTNNTYSTKEWEGMIDAALSAGQNDYHIYDLIRRHVLGSSLEDDLCTGIRQTASSSTQATADSSDGSNGNGRANVMVKMALGCIPSTTRLRLGQGRRYMLDYGCAEGSITSSLGQALGMKPEYVLGADVRAIPSEGFSFIQLPAEDPSRPPAPKSILSSLRDQSVEFVTVSMVLHHVTHIEAVLQELRRVIAHDGLLLLREHHCCGPEMAAFLDITHGLYSLSWSHPVEWPDFVTEYKAFYRSQNQWDALLLKAGFKLALQLDGSEAAASYHSVQVLKRKANGWYPNVIKAYYAVYQPVSIETFATTAQPSKRHLDDDACVKSHDGEVLKRRSTMKQPDEKLSEATTTAAAAAKSIDHSGPRADGQLFESKKYPGRFYRVNQLTGATEWIP